MALLVVSRPMISPAFENEKSELRKNAHALTYDIK
jgi:hypothetical protein